MPIAQFTSLILIYSMVSFKDKLMYNRATHKLFQLGSDTAGEEIINDSCGQEFFLFLLDFEAIHLFKINPTTDPSLLADSAFNDVKKSSFEKL